MKSIKLRQWAVVIGCVCSGGLVSPAGALVLTFDDVALLGEIDHGRGKQELFINQLARMTPSTTDAVRGTTYVRSGNQFGSLPEAGLEFKVNGDHTGIALDGSFSYLVARYGSVTTVWYVGGLTGSYDLPASYNGKRGLSHYSLVRGLQAAAAPAPNGASVVNDSGSTLALLGLSLTSLGLFRSQFKKTQTVAPH